MVDIISKSDGPRREDERARRMIQANRGAVTQIADHLTQGAYSANKRAKAAGANAPPAPEGKLIYDGGASSSFTHDTGDVRVKVSLNNRVVAYDGGSGKQVHMFGEIRRQESTRYFALASRENGFFADLPEDIVEKIGELDGQIIDQACPETLLASEIAERLGFS